MKEILDIIHKTIYQFFDVCGDDEETPMSDKDKLLLEVNKAICNNLKALPPVQLPQNIIRCKDCRFYTNFQKGKPWNVSKKYCNRVVTIKTSPDDFCSFAKAKVEESEIHCSFTDAEIAKSFIEDVEAVKDLLPKRSGR